VVIEARATPRSSRTGELKQEGVMEYWQFDVIAELASRGLFRERDLTHRKVSLDWLFAAKRLGRVTQRGRGVWSHSELPVRRWRPIRPASEDRVVESSIDPLALR
jgi:hypothetical protein